MKAIVPVASEGRSFAVRFAAAPAIKVALPSAGDGDPVVIEGCALPTETVSELLAAAFDESPLYSAVYECEPTESESIENVARPPLTETVASRLPPSRKTTVPVGRCRTPTAVSTVESA